MFSLFRHQLSFRNIFRIQSRDWSRLLLRSWRTASCPYIIPLESADQPRPPPYRWILSKHALECPNGSAGSDRCCKCHIKAASYRIQPAASQILISPDSPLLHPPKSVYMNAPESFVEPLLFWFLKFHLFIHPIPKWTQGRITLNNLKYFLPSSTGRHTPT